MRIQMQNQKKKHASIEKKTNDFGVKKLHTTSSKATGCIIGIATMMIIHHHAIIEIVIT